MPGPKIVVNCSTTCLTVKSWRNSR